MHVYQERLAERLHEKNGEITYEQALVWVELLWEDFEATYAKAGREYAGAEMTERVVSQWIENYGSRLHEFLAGSAKYQKLMNGQTKLN